jgi:tRNA pseudouridine38-40 synthase
MRNIKLIIEYDGSRYQGWQQPGNEESAGTISGRILSVLRKMTQEEIQLRCALRTEAGVHAYRQTVNFKTDCEFTDAEIKSYLNRYLPMDIAIVEVEDMPERFHANLNAKDRSYLYQIVTGDVPSVFERKYSWYSYLPLNVEAMRQAAPLLCGRRDFQNFSTGKTNKSTIRTVYSIDIEEAEAFLLITICATDFLHNMARLMLGTLIEIGTGRRKKESIEAIFAGFEAPGEPCDPKGLILQNVSYSVEYP